MVDMFTINILFSLGCFGQKTSVTDEFSLVALLIDDPVARPEKFFFLKNKIESLRLGLMRLNL